MANGSRGPDGLEVALRAGIMLPMIDPVDDVTRPLPVATTSPIRLQFASPEGLQTVVLMQDLLEHWMLIQTWAGRRDVRRSPKTRLFDNHDAGLAALEALANRNRKAGYTLVA